MNKRVIQVWLSSISLSLLCIYACTAPQDGKEGVQTDAPVVADASNSAENNTHQEQTTPPDVSNPAPDASQQKDESGAVDTAPVPEKALPPEPSPPEKTQAEKPPANNKSPKLAGCSIFPADNPWNTDISKAPVDPNSDKLIASIGRETGLHPDFGTQWKGVPNGIPYVVVPANQKKVKVSFRYASESDPGPYPIPANAPIEGGPNGTGDRHVLVLQQGTCMLYELFNAFKQSDGSWKAGSGAIFRLNTNKLRPEKWTSADAAGLPIIPGLVKYEEVMAGEIKHALRFTVVRSRKAYVHPATHWASSRTSADLPPMGMRVRLKASYDISSFPKSVQVILRAMKKYGMFVADNGSNWFVSGAPNPKWSDSDLRALKRVKGKDFEVVKMGKIYTP